MRDTVSVAKRSGYVVTDAGRRALVEARTCHCAPSLEGLLYVCKECGTVLWRYESSGNSLSRGWEDRR